MGKDSGSLVSFAGPHYSNILASGILHDRYIVTVGSLATVVVWSPSWSVLAAHTEESATQSKESVARYLSVLALDETRFLVGGSDGVVSLYRFIMGDGLELLSKSTVASSYPKPVLSLAKAIQEDEPTFIVSGDSGGRLIVSTVDESDRFTVRTETTVAKCSINCLDATMQRSENGNSFRGVCGCDSGSILVFEVANRQFRRPCFAPLRRGCDSTTIDS
ncbi:hypothetical protein ADEAN_000054200 [Angomonas deanei]|uniref:WD domain, G-beta repeat n=1 Tax=Angomonas deanei TaxID=59799 RepID=A0A7G2C0C2_9TRYP|nr:hypothetical protein ADEAN_000054200 [Angomonas deanei]